MMRPTMRPTPEITLEMVVCMPKETAIEVTPRAVTAAVGEMPKTGSITIRTATDQIRTRTMLTKMEPRGTLPMLKTRATASVAACCRIQAASTTTARSRAFHA